MAIQLDHTIVPSRDKAASARRLAELLGVAWEPSAIGPFAAGFAPLGFGVTNTRAEPILSG